MEKKENRAGKSGGMNRKVWTYVLLAVLGIFLIVWPASSVAALVRLVGAALIVIGTVGAVQQVTSPDEKKSARILRILLNAVFVAAGIWVLVNPVLFENLIHFVIGVVILVFSVKDLYLAIREKKKTGWVILPGIGVVLGILTAVKPFGEFRTFAVFAGAALLYTGAASLINELKTDRG